MAAASTPPRPSCLASRSAPCLVRTKNSVRRRAGGDPGSRPRSCRRAARVKTRWSIAPAPRRSGRRRARPGRSGTASTSVATSRSSVAENSRRCPPAGVCRAAASRPGRKPRSAMWSASSSTVISTWSSRHAPRSMRSMSRPGVATTTSTPRFEARRSGGRTERRRRRWRRAGRRRLRRAARARRRPAGPARGWGRGRGRAERCGVRGRRRGQPGEHGQAEGEGLAGPGLRAAEDVTAGQRVGQRAGLDGEGRVDAAACRGR